MDATVTTALSFQRVKNTCFLSYVYPVILSKKPRGFLAIFLVSNKMQFLFQYIQLPYNLLLVTLKGCDPKVIQFY